MAEATEKKVTNHIKEHGEIPREEYYKFLMKRKGHLGLELLIDVALEDYGLLYKFSLSANKVEYEKWARENIYIMEGFMTFRVGPVIVAHPGRDPRPLVTAGKERKKPINIWEITFGFLTENETTYFNLLRNRIVVHATRNRNPEGQHSPAWLVYRLK